MKKKKTEKKYEFTGETMQFEGHTLKRIRYIRSFSQNIANEITEGELGGWLEGEHNLSHDGTCFVSEEAKVFGNAEVIEDAIICNTSVVKDNAKISGSCYLYSKCVVGADTILAGNTTVGDSHIYFYSKLLNNDTEANPVLANIGGESWIENSTIEATGFLMDIELKNRKLFGDLDSGY